MNYDRVNAQLKAKFRERREYLECEVKYMLSVNPQVKMIEGVIIGDCYAAGKIYAHRNEIEFINSLINHSTNTETI